MIFVYFGLIEIVEISVWLKSFRVHESAGRPFPRTRCPAGGNTGKNVSTVPPRCLTICSVGIKIPNRNGLVFVHQSRNHSTLHGKPMTIQYVYDIGNTYCGRKRLSKSSCPPDIDSNSIVVFAEDENTQKKRTTPVFYPARTFVFTLQTYFYSSVPFGPYTPVASVRASAPPRSVSGRVTRSGRGGGFCAVTCTRGVSRRLRARSTRLRRHVQTSVAVSTRDRRSSRNRPAYSDGTRTHCIKTNATMVLFPVFFVWFNVANERLDDFSVFAPRFGDSSRVLPSPGDAYSRTVLRGSR